MSIAIGAHATAANAGPSATSVTTTGVTTTGGAGTVFVAAIGAFNGAPSSLTDSKGNTYTQVGSTQASSADANLRLAIYECIGGTGGASHTFTGHTGSGAVISIWVVEVTGVSTASPRDQAPAISDDTASPYTSGTANTTQANEALISFASTFSSSGTETLTWGNSFTGLDAQTNANADITGGSATRLVTATGAYSSSFTSAGAGTAAALVGLVTYMEASAGATYTLTASSGSFAITGFGGSVNLQYQLTADVGTYAITGNAANLVYSGAGATYTLTAAAGVFTITGSSANLVQEWVMAAATGTFTITGNSAGLVQGWVLPASAGSFFVTGRAATLVYSGAPVQLALSWPTTTSWPSTGALPSGTVWPTTGKWP